jgi:hypothetical protein
MKSWYLISLFYFLGTNDSSRRSTEKSSDDGNNSYADIRKKLRDNIGMSYISPTTGKI